MSVVKFKMTGAIITLLTRKAVSARQRHQRREGKMAFVFLIRKRSIRLREVRLTNIFQWLFLPPIKNTETQNVGNDS